MNLLACNTSSFFFSSLFSLPPHSTDVPLLIFLWLLLFFYHIHWTVLLVCFWALSKSYHTSSLPEFFSSILHNIQSIYLKCFAFSFSLLQNTLLYQGTVGRSPVTIHPFLEIPIIWHAKSTSQTSCPETLVHAHSPCWSSCTAVSILPHLSSLIFPNPSTNGGRFPSQAFSHLQHF